MMELMEEELGNNQTLVELLYGNVSDILIGQYVELNNTLVSAGFTAQLEALDLLEPLVSGQEIDCLSVPGEVDGIFREAARLALMTCGVFFDEDTDLGLLTELCQTILHFDPTETPQTLIDKLSAADDDIDALCITLEYLTDRPYDDWLPVIANVGVGLIDRINDLAHRANDDATSTDDLTLKAQYDFAQRLTRLKELVKDNDDVIPAVTSEPSMESLYLLHVPMLLDSSVSDATNSIMVISCLSHPTKDGMLKATSTLLDDLYDDPIKRMEAERVRDTLIPTYGKLYE